MGYRLPVLILLVMMACGREAPEPPEVPAQSAALPSTPVHTLDGAPAAIPDLARGRVAVVSLWATWCDACQDELQALNRLDASTAARHDVLVIGVAVGETAATVAAFARRRGLRYLQLVDEDFRFADAIGQREVPVTLVVNRDGRVVFRGHQLDAEGLAALRTALAR